MKKRVSKLLASGGFILNSAPAWAARDFQGVANSAVSIATGVAVASVGLGIIVGAVLYQIPPAAGYARKAVTGGVIGAFLTFTALAIVSTLKQVTGG